MPVWDVYKGQRFVMRYEEKPGPIGSSALLPKNMKPPMHPFLTISPGAPEEEDRTRIIMEASKSPAEFRAKLEEAGYTVKKS